MVPFFPSKWTNKFYFLFKFLNWALNFYPLKLLSHNFRFFAILDKKKLDKKKLYFDPKWRNPSIGQGIG